MVPVLVGTSTVDALEASMWWRILAALVVSVALQVAVNYANDYSDGVKGTDADRVGPVRLVGSGLVEPRVVKWAAFSMLGVAAAAGAVLAATTSWWLLVVGAVSMVAAWTYTGGPRPYGYAGLGEVFVFVFFGVVATVGTQFVVGREFTWLSMWASVGVGAFSCALLVVNNLRDREGDLASGKVTLAVRIGDQRTREMFAALFVMASAATVLCALLVGAWALLGLVGVVRAVPAVLRVRGGAMGRDLIGVLGLVGSAQLVYGVLFALGVGLALA